VGADDEKRMRTIGGSELRHDVLPRVAARPKRLDGHAPSAFLERPRNPGSGALQILRMCRAARERGSGEEPYVAFEPPGIRARPAIPSEPFDHRLTKDDGKYQEQDDDTAACCDEDAGQGSDEHFLL